MDTSLSAALNRLVKSYAKLVFAFALRHTAERHEAEDLAQDIMLQLVGSISSGAQIRNLDSYVWTVARYTWVRWVDQKVKARRVIETNSVPDAWLDCSLAPLDRVVDDETKALLRREIGYLSEMRRRIVVLHYYKGLKQAAIARLLQIPVGTVKWHLHEAKSELKRGMEEVRSNSELSFNPIRLIGMGHSGQPGNMGDTSDFLRSSLAQNIVYAAYQQPLSVEALARGLCTPAPFMEDMVRFLVEYEYMIEVSRGQYQTNFVIWNTTADQHRDLHRVYKESVTRVADLHYEGLMDMRSEVEESELYYPDRDYNFLLWTLLPKNAEEQAVHAAQTSGFPDFQEAVPIRKDGGRYIAFAHLYQDRAEPEELGFGSEYYGVNGPMVRCDGNGLYLWQIGTYWSGQRDWRNLHIRDAAVCDMFWKGELSDDEAHAEQYAFLLEKGYVVRTQDGFKFNAVWVNSLKTAEALSALLPDLVGEYRLVVEKLSGAYLEIMMRNKPKQIENQVAYMAWLNAKSGYLLAYMLKHLVDNGKLQPPRPEQRKTLSTFMGWFR